MFIDEDGVNRPDKEIERVGGSDAPSAYLNHLSEPPGPRFGFLQTLGTRANTDPATIFDPTKYFMPLDLARTTRLVFPQECSSAGNGIKID